LDAADLSRMSSGFPQPSGGEAKRRRRCALPAHSKSWRPCSGSWAGPTVSWSHIGTMNRFVLVLVVLVLGSKATNRGRERRRGGGSCIGDSGFL